MRYILSSAVITAPGRYDYRHITVSAAKEWLSRGPYKSTIGYAETAEALAVLTGRQIPHNREQITMEPGDSALVFRLTRRLRNVDLKGKQGTQFVLDHHELGVLTRMDDVVRVTDDMQLDGMVALARSLFPLDSDEDAVAQSIEYLEERFGLRMEEED